MNIVEKLSFQLISFPLKHRESSNIDAALLKEDRTILFTFLQEKLSQQRDLAEIHRIDLPDFKTGTLDVLVSSGEELARVDPMTEGILTRLVSIFKQLGADNQMREREGKTEAEGQLLVEDLSTEDFIRQIEWNRLKYRIDLTIPELMAMLEDEVLQIDTLVKQRLQQYQMDRSRKQCSERKFSGSLAGKDLSNIITEKDFYPESEYIETVFVAVPRIVKDEFTNTYEHWEEMMVVPQSAHILAEESDFTLYAVGIFKRFHDKFKRAASERKCIVRDDFKFDEQRIASTRIESANLAESVRSQWSSLIRLIRQSFSDAFIALAHIKSLRLYVESVLRYGLPAHFLIISLRPVAKSRAKKARKSLLNALDKLRLPGISSIDIATALQIDSTGLDDDQDTNDSMASKEENELWNQLNMASAGNEPYVKFDFKWYY